MSNENTNNSGRNVNKLMDAETWDAMKASGFSQEELLKDQPWGPMISAYTRQQAIEDGTLVDLTNDPKTATLVRMAGLRIPVAMTATAFHDTILAGTTEDADGHFIFPDGQDFPGRLWDVLMVLVAAARRNRDTDRVNFSVRVWDGKAHTIVKLWSLCGPGDNAEPVLTIMLQGED